MSSSDGLQSRHSIFNNAFDRGNISEQQDPLRIFRHPEPTIRTPERRPSLAFVQPNFMLAFSSARLRKVTIAYFTIY